MIQTSKHTPGPWKLHLVDDTSIIDVDGNEVANVGGDYNQPDLWPQMEANARLISAAPEMLEALKAIDAYWLESVPSGPNGDLNYGVFGHMSEDTAVIWRAIQSAIAKAEAQS